MERKEMMKILKTLPIAVILVSSAASLPAWADTASLEARLDDLEQQVAILKRQIENNKEEAAAKSQDTPIITANSKDGFSIKSPNEDFKLKIGGYVQADARQFADNKKDLNYNSAFLPRRVRLIIQGNVTRDFGYYIQPDFGFNDTFSTISSTSPSAFSASLQDAWVDYHYFQWATIRGGKFKTPFDIENLQDTRYTNFAELGLTGNLSPQRDVGFQVSGSVLNDRLNYAVGIFGGAADHENFYGGSSTAGSFGNNKNGTGRIFTRPFKDTNIGLISGFGIGYAASYGKQRSSDIPTFISPGQAPVFSYNSAGATAVSANGPQLRGSPQFYYYYKSLGVLGEYVDSEETLQYKNGARIIKDKIDNKAWQLSCTYVLTGEDASYNGVTPRHNFDLLNGGWGALELAGRYGQLTIDPKAFDDGFANLNTSISGERAWGLGINWYLNRNVKLVLDFEQTKFKRGAVNGASTDDRKTENLFTSRFQLGF
jgi:phosphate-selective porin OprO and OprP